MLAVATSDTHDGLVHAPREAFPGLIWQRCQAHTRRNVIDQTPSGYRDRMHQIMNQLLEASSQSDMQRRFEEVSEKIEVKTPTALEVLGDGLFVPTAVGYPQAFCSPRSMSHPDFSSMMKTLCTEGIHHRQ